MSIRVNFNNYLHHRQYFLTFFGMVINKKLMRPTDLKFRSPKERTPGHNYEIFVIYFHPIILISLLIKVVHYSLSQIPLVLTIEVKTLEMTITQVLYLCHVQQDLAIRTSSNFHLSIQHQGLSTWM